MQQARGRRVPGTRGWGGEAAKRWEVLGLRAFVVVGIVSALSSSCFALVQMKLTRTILSSLRSCPSSPPSSPEASFASFHLPSTRPPSASAAPSSFTPSLSPSTSPFHSTPSDASSSSPIGGGIPGRLCSQMGESAEQEFSRSGSSRRSLRSWQRNRCRGRECGCLLV